MVTLPLQLLKVHIGVCTAWLATSALQFARWHALICLLACFMALLSVCVSILAFTPCLPPCLRPCQVHAVLSSLSELLV